MRKIEHRTRIGTYEFAQTDKGYRVWGKEFGKSGISIPSDERLGALYAEYQQGTLSVSYKSMLLWLGLRGVVAEGKRKVDVGKKALGLPTREDRCLKKLQTIRTFWPEKVVRAYAEENEEPQSPYLLREFNKKHRSIRRVKTPKEFDNLLQQAYPQYPGFYAALRNKVHLATTDRQRVTSKLLDLIAQRRSVAQDDFSHSEEYAERRLGRQVACLARHDCNKYLEEVEQLTHMKKSEISLLSEGHHACAHIAENLTRFLFVWAPLVNLDLRPYATGVPLIEKKECAFTYHALEGKKRRKLGYADMRMGNTAIDAKTGAIPLKTKAAADIEAKYARGQSLWEPEGTKMTRGVLVFHEEPRFYESFIPSFRSKSIMLFPYKEFHECLGEIVSRMKKNYRSEIAYVSPRIHDLSYLLHIHKKISHEQTMRVFIHAGNQEEWHWSKQVLKELIAQGMVRYD